MAAITLTAGQAARARSLLTEALAFNTKSPAADALALFVEGRRIGTLSPKAFDEIASSTLAHWFVREGRCVEFSPDVPLEAAFARAADVFHRSGFFFQWRDELLDVRDLMTGEIVSRAERGLFRYFGMATQCVYAVGVDQAGRIFMSRRSETKQVDPGLWDTLAAGLVSAGEAPFVSLRRELAEEAGLDEGYALEAGGFSRFAVRRPVEEGWMHEDAFCLKVFVQDARSVHNVDGEVSVIECAGVDALLSRIERRLVPSDSAVAFLTALLKA